MASHVDIVRVGAYVKLQGWSFCVAEVTFVGAGSFIGNVVDLISRDIVASREEFSLSEAWVPADLSNGKTEAG